MTKAFGPVTKFFNGKKYWFVHSYDHSRDAYRIAKQIRQSGRNARVVEVSNDVERGGPGYAVYGR